MLKSWSNQPFSSNSEGAHRISKLMKQPMYMLQLDVSYQAEIDYSTNRSTTYSNRLRPPVVTV